MRRPIRLQMPLNTDSNKAYHMRNILRQMTPSVVPKKLYLSVGLATAVLSIVLWLSHLGFYSLLVNEIPE